MHITFITESQQSNSLGRTYCLWLLARSLGWTTTVLTTGGSDVWRPLKGTEFSEDIVVTRPADAAAYVPPDADLIVACKPLPRSLGLALGLARQLRKPLLLDIDDPDLQIRMRAGNPALALARWARYPSRSWTDSRYARLSRSLPTLVSNPWLRQEYGGVVVPHVRENLGDGAPHRSHEPVVAFIGSVHPHKGIEVLRRAVESLRGDGFSLTVTAPPPADARPGEHWIGETSLQEGLRLVSQADIIALPSLDRRNARGQLPVKLIDAMMFGRAVIVSDVPPLPWAVGDSALVVPAGRTPPLVDALAQLKDPGVRVSLGRRARRRALKGFTVDALAETFARACEDAADRGTPW